MDNQEHCDNSIRHALDARLSGIVEKPDFQQRMLRQVRGEIVVKKKLSMGFVLILALTLVTISAIAATLLWDNYARQVKQTEQDKGYYEEWPAKDKIDLVRALTEMGYIAESDETTQLFDASTADADAHRIADQLLMNLTQREVYDISLIEITESIWGFYTTWTPERKAWWQSIENIGGEPSPDAVIMVMPEEGDLSEEEAIRITKEANLKAFGLQEDYLDGDYQVYTELYVTPARPEYRRWYVQISGIEKEEGTEGPGLLMASMDARTGTVIADPDRGTVLPEEWKEILNEKRPEQLSHPLYAAIRELAEEAGSAMLWNRSLEQKAAYSAKINPIVKEIMDSGDLTPITFDGYVDNSIIAASTYTYGLPGEQDISQEQALKYATKAIQQAYSIVDSTISLYKNISTFFDVTNPEKPLWRFLIQPDTWRDFEGGLDNQQYNLRYRVEIDARSGETVSTEEFEFSIKDWKDLESELRFH